MKTFALLAVVLAACGGGSEDGDSIISGTIQGSYEGDDFTPKFGIATFYENQAIIFLSEGGISCANAETAGPRGYGLIVSGFAYTTAGPQADISVSVYKNTAGHFSSRGSSGDLTLTEIDDATVAGSLDFDRTDTDDPSHVYTAHGDFVVTHCAQ